MKTFDQFYQALNEGKFRGTSSDTVIQNYIDLIYAATDPDESEGDIDEILDMAKSNLSPKIYNDLVRLADLAHFPRPGRSFGSDNLEWRKSLSKRVTKAGKLNANDVRALKRSILDDHRKSPKMFS